MTVGDLAGPDAATGVTREGSEGAGAPPHLTALAVGACELPVLVVVLVVFFVDVAAGRVVAVVIVGSVVVVAAAAAAAAATASRAADRHSGVPALPVPILDVFHLTIEDKSAREQ